MPISPENRCRYPTDWPEISAEIKRRSGGCCECRGECGRHYGRCHERQGEIAGTFRGTVILTVAHLDHQPENCTPWNLRAMCQRCHNRYDAKHRAQTRARRRAEAAAAAGQGQLPEAGV